MPTILPQFKSSTTLIPNFIPPWPPFLLTAIVPNPPSPILHTIPPQDLVVSLTLLHTDDAPLSLPDPQTPPCRWPSPQNIPATSKPTPYRSLSLDPSSSPTYMPNLLPTPRKPFLTVMELDFIKDVLGFIGDWLSTLRRFHTEVDEVVGRLFLTDTLDKDEGLMAWLSEGLPLVYGIEGLPMVSWGKGLPTVQARRLEVEQVWKGFKAKVQDGLADIRAWGSVPVTSPSLCTFSHGPMAGFQGP